MTRGNATTSWHDKTTAGRRNERQHNLVVFQVQTESTGEVAAVVMLVLSINQSDWVLEMRSKRASELEVVASICGIKWHTPSSGCYKAPPDFSPLNV